MTNELIEKEETTEGSEKNRSLAVNALEGFAYFLVDTIKTIIIVVVIAFLIRFYLVQPFYVSGNSMRPNYVDQEYLLIDEVSYHFNLPQRGDVIVFKYPLNPRETYIKRVIGLPGEKVKVKDGKVTIYNDKNPDGQILTEDYLPQNLLTDGDKEWNLDEGEYIVLGDNRPDSSDSRVWGILPRQNIIGKSWLYFNLRPLKQIYFGKFVFSIPAGVDRFGIVKKPDYSNLTMQLFDF